MNEFFKVSLTIRVSLCEYHEVHVCGDVQLLIKVLSIDLFFSIHTHADVHTCEFLKHNELFRQYFVRISFKELHPFNAQ